MKESPKKNWSTSRQSRRQNVAPDVSPGTSNAYDSQPSKRAAEELSLLTRLKRFLKLPSAGLRPGLHSSVICDGSLNNLVLVSLCVIALPAAILLFGTRGSASPVPAPQDQSIDFSKFRHDNTNHGRLPCLLCHRREGNAAKPALPGGGGHLPCTGCHAKEFSNSSSPVCAICHTNSQSGVLKAFPPLRSFGVKFDHAAHARGLRMSCSTCHRPLRSGQALSIPTGANGHLTCYQCHAPQAQANGRDISSCGTCHQPGGYSRTSTQAAAFKVGFSHAKHVAQKLNCTECHNVRAGMPQRKQVTAPLPLNHHAPAGTTSCATCHNGKRAFGGDDFSTCTKCHRGPQWHF